MKLPGYQEGDVQQTKRQHISGTTAINTSATIVAATTTNISLLFESMCNGNSVSEPRRVHKDEVEYKQKHTEFLLLVVNVNQLTNKIRE